MNIELVVFDMAGTTVSDKGNINQAFRDAFTAEGLDVAAADVDKVMGYRKIEAVAIIIDQYKPDLIDKKEVIERIHEKFNQDMVLFYENDPALKSLPYAEELFQQLSEQGIKVALNTGFTRRITNAILKRLQWNSNPNIHQVICSDEVQEGRPHPFMIQTLMETFGINDELQVAKIGDTQVDVMEGRNAGCGLVIAITTGAYTREQLMEYEPDFIIDSLQEIPELIKTGDRRFI